MAICKDQSLTYLNKFGYNVVRLPRTGINPLDVLGKNKVSYERLGRLDQIWESTVNVPGPNAPQFAPQINVVQTGKIKLSVGLKILGNILSSFGVAGASLESSFQGVHTLKFSFGMPEIVSIDIFKIGDFMSNGNLKSQNPVVKHYFEEEEARTFVLSEILKTDTISVKSFNEAGVEMKADVSGIQETVNGKVNVSAGRERNTEIIYKGNEKLVFGFKAFEIIWNDGRWELGIQPKPGKMFLGVRHESPKPEILTPNMRMDFRDVEDLG